MSTSSTSTRPSSPIDVEANKASSKKRARSSYSFVCWGHEMQHGSTACEQRFLSAGGGAFREHFCSRCRSEGVFIESSRLYMAPRERGLKNERTCGAWNECTRNVTTPWPPHRVLNQTSDCSGPTLVVVRDEVLVAPPGLVPLPMASSGTVLVKFRVGRTLTPATPLPALAFATPLPALAFTQWPAPAPAPAPAQGGQAEVAALFWPLTDFIDALSLDEQEMAGIGSFMGVATEAPPQAFPMTHAYMGPEMYAVPTHAAPVSSLSSLLSHFPAGGGNDYIAGAPSPSLDSFAGPDSIMLDAGSMSLPASPPAPLLPERAPTLLEMRKRDRGVARAVKLLSAQSLLLVVVGFCTAGGGVSLSMRWHFAAAVLLAVGMPLTLLLAIACLDVNELPKTDGHHVIACSLWALHTAQSVSEMLSHAPGDTPSSSINAAFLTWALCSCISGAQLVAASFKYVKHSQCLRCSYIWIGLLTGIGNAIHRAAGGAPFPEGLVPPPSSPAEGPNADFGNFVRVQVACLAYVCLGVSFAPAMRKRARAWVVL